MARAVWSIMPALFLMMASMTTPAVAAPDPSEWSWDGYTPDMECTANVYLVSDDETRWIIAAIAIALLAWAAVEIYQNMRELDPAPSGFHYEYDLECVATGTNGYVDVTIPDAIGETVAIGTWDEQTGTWVEQYSTTCTADPCTVSWSIPPGTTLIVEEQKPTPYPTYVAHYMEEACMGVQVIATPAASYSMLNSGESIARDAWESLLGSEQVAYGPPDDQQTCQDRVDWTITGTDTVAQALANAAKLVQG